MKSAFRCLIFTLCVAAMNADAHATWKIFGGRWRWVSAPTQPYTPPATGGSTGSSGGYTGGGSGGTGGGTPAVPEPGTVLLMASGIAAVAVVRRRRKSVAE